MFGTAGGVLYSLISSASAMGALNASIFATARLCVAASKRQYFPMVLANLHLQPGEKESDYYERTLLRTPSVISKLVQSIASSTETLRLEDEVPV